MRDATYWTIAYRNRRANHFKRAQDLATDWHSAMAKAGAIKERLPHLDIWVLQTREAENAGYACAEDCGNILLETGKRIAVRDTGSLAELAAMG
ncbi:hypothetical protein SEA_REINDEER_155 [Mycobacterium phage Reindeer]|uniref:Uncharacterized protein n=1 Tax=Mycobacterium phage Reindeer TaxID=2762283 RepID=A0A7G8LI74_9CAUD|nr:hypothetical protein J4U05_gp097 [Mycobacterium phage Reindeer]QNJ56946.1 hypothetical protein SEA_REINDEER_155 [Mycobacterium phage Reindeer]